MTREVVSIDLDQIDATGRLRDVNQDKLAAIVLSYQTVGQLTPVEVTEKAVGGYRLIAGGHRVEAAKLCGWKQIEAFVFKGSKDEARLVEIDENLARVELSAFDQANFMEERRQIWGKLHGNIKRGGDRRSKVQVGPLIDQLRNPGFVAETAASFGLSRSVVKRALGRKAGIIPALWDTVRGTDAANNGALLDKLSKLLVEEQAEVLAAMAERRCGAAAALRVVMAPPIQDPEIVQFDALRMVWAKAGPGARAAFLKSIAATP